jgi:hypothetical protein
MYSTAVKFLLIDKNKAEVEIEIADVLPCTFSRTKTSLFMRAIPHTFSLVLVDVLVTLISIPSFRNSFYPSTRQETIFFPVKVVGKKNSKIFLLFLFAFTERIFF